jgi:hypothetical protein
MLLLSPLRVRDGWGTVWYFYRKEGNMSSSFRFLIPFLAVCASLAAQTYASQAFNVTVQKSVGYNGWTSGWDTVHVAKNDLITLAVVPKLGGRVMQYDLGTNKSLFVYNSNQVPSSGDSMVGGFRMLPSPQSDFGWPSPPNLDLNPYLCAIRTNNTDSAVIYLESKVENSTDTKYQKHKGLQFKRLITLYKASTRVKVEMTMLNKGTQTMMHGIWDITQTACKNDSNSWVYFKRNPSSTLGGGKGYVHYASAPGGALQWNPNAAEGNIMGVRFLKTVGKIGADCKAGWICFNDRATGYAYVKTFAYQEGQTYPDSGASVQVYTYAAYNMLEVEVLGPNVTLAAGDSTKLVENWYAARSLGPVLDVNGAGLITKRLAAQQTADTVALTGTFGVFYPGTVKTQFCNASGSVVAIADSVAVLPSDSLRVNKKLGVPAGATIIRLAALDAAGTLIGTLDSVAVPNPVNLLDRRFFSNRTGNISILSGKKGQLQIIVPFEGICTTKLFTIDGKLTATFTGRAPYRYPVTISNAAAKVLFVRIEGPQWTVNKVLCIPGK